MGVAGKPMSFRLGAIVQMASRYASVIITMGLTMILARILTPDDYGIMSVVTVFLGLFTVISNAGINAAVIQYRDLTDSDLGGLLAYTLILGIGMAALFCLLSIPVSLVYHNSEYIPLMCFASASVFLRSLDMVPDGVQIRDRKFALNGARTIISSIIGGVVAVLLALAGWGTYALIVNNILQALVIVTWNLVASGMRPVFSNMSAPVKRVQKFSNFQLISQIAQYLVRNLDNLCVGYFLGSAALGQYDKAYKLSKYPIDYVPSTINPVLKSYFSSKQDDKDRLYESFLKVQVLLAIIGVAAGVIFFFSAQELILLFFGDQWVEAIAPFRFLSLSIPFQLVNYTVFSALEGLKRTDLLVKNISLNCALTILLLALGIAIGSLESVALCVSIGFMFATPSYLWFVIHRGFGKPVLGYLKKLAPSFVCGLLSAAALTVFTVCSSLVGLPALAAKVLIGGGVYVTFLLFFHIAEQRGASRCFQ